VQHLDLELINNLVGVQLGAAARFPVGQTVSVGARAAIGLFANLVERQRIFQELQTGSEFTLKDNKTWTRFSQAVEAAVDVAWEFMPNWVVSLGYQMLLLNDVSVAPSHFRTVAVKRDDNARANSRVIYHGTVLRVGVSF